MTPKNSSIRSLIRDPLFREMFVFSLPVMVMTCFQLLFNTTDMVVVGLFSGSDALAAIGATGAIINLIVQLFMGMTVGTSVAVARDYGAGNMEDVSRSTHTSIALGIIGGIVVMVLGLVFSKPLAVVMGTPENIIDLAVQYLRIYFFSMPASLIYNFGAAILRAVGDSRRPMYYLGVAGGIHLVLNLFFVIVLDMSVAGVAWSTVISQYLAALLILLSLSKYKGAVRFMPKALRIDPQKLGFILRIGLPAGVQGLLFSISNVLVQSAVNSFGSVMIAANAAASNVEGYINTTNTAYYNAAITYTAQSMGAKNYSRISTIAKICTVYIFTTWVVVCGLVFLFPEPLLRIFTSDPEVILLGKLRMSMMMISFFTAGVMNVFPGLSRAMGYSLSPMFCTLVGNCLVRIGWLYTIFAWNPTEVMLFACYPVSWTIAGVGQVIIYLFARRKLRMQEGLPEPSLS